MLDCFARYAPSSRLKYLVILLAVSLVPMEVGWVGLYETKALSGNRFEQAKGGNLVYNGHFLLFHALMPKIMATMTEIEGRITPIMI
jgi:hypothetical protein